MLEITLSNVTYKLGVKWNAFAAYWVLDFADQNDAPILRGIPLVTGIDLLGQHKHIIPAGMLVAQTDGDAFAVPTADNLGTKGHIFYVIGDLTDVSST